MADAASEDAPECRAEFRLVPGQLGLEVAFARRLVLEESMKSQAASWNRNSDCRVLGQAMDVGRRKRRHQGMVLDGADAYQYW